MDSNDLKPTPSNGLHLRAAGVASSQSNERNYPSLSRPFPRKQHGILPYRAEVRGKPIANVNEPLVFGRQEVNDPSSNNRHVSPHQLFGRASAQLPWRNRAYVDRLFLPYLRVDPLICWAQAINEHSRG